MKADGMKKSRASRQELRLLAQKFETQLQSIRQMTRKRLVAEYAKGDLTAPQRLVMSVVCQADGLSVKELSQRVCLAHSTVSGIVDRLEKRGLVSRRVNRKDRRISEISASPIVREFLKKRAPALSLHPLVLALGKATAAERNAVEAGLETLERLLEQVS